MTASAAKDAGISVAVCGEAAADPLLAVLFAAMGIDELSVAAPLVNTIKKTLSTVDAGALDDAWDAALGCASAAEVRATVAPLIR